MTLPRASATIALLATVIGIGLASTASANFVTIGVDPAGDSIDPNPGRDIVKVGLAYDRRTGHLRGGVMLNGTPSGAAPANLTLFAGYQSASGCNGYPAIGFGTQTDLSGADWVMLRSAGAQPVNGRANKIYTAAAEEYEATVKQLAGKRPNCVIAQLNDPANPATVYDVAGPYRLRGLPELDVRIGKVPAAMKPNRTRKIRVKVSNPGDAKTGPVRLTVGKARGMKVRMPRKLATIKPGARRTVALRVTLNRRARSTTTLTLTATARKGLRARDQGNLYRSRPAPPSGGGGGSGSGSKLCFRYTWLPPYSTLVPC